MADPEEAKRGELLSMWSIQESILQRYRSIFISSEAFLFSATALLLKMIQDDRNLFLYVPTVLLIGLGAWLACLWEDLTDDRGMAVTYCQSLVLMYENSCEGDEKREKNRREHMARPFSKFKEFLGKGKAGQNRYMQDDLYCKEWLEKAENEWTTRKKLQEMPKFARFLWAIFFIIFMVIVFIPDALIMKDFFKDSRNAFFIADILFMIGAAAYFIFGKSLPQD